MTSSLVVVENSPMGYQTNNFLLKRKDEDGGWSSVQFGLRKASVKALILPVLFSAGPLCLDLESELPFTCQQELLEKKQNLEPEG